LFHGKQLAVNVPRRAKAAKGARKRMISGARRNRISTMAETKSSSGESENAIRRVSARLRLLAFTALVLAAVALVIWIRSETWLRVAQLESEFAAVRSEQFQLGLHARESIVRMNAALLRFQLSGETDEQQMFLRIGRDLTNRLARTLPLLSTEAEHAAAKSFEQALATYRRETADMILRAARPIRKDTAGQIHDIVVEKSRAVVELSDDLVAAQERSYARFLDDSRRTMISLRQMLWVSVIALLFFTALLAILAYSAFIAPLRAMLSQSQAIIARHETLASLGTLAAGVAHEIRNPLQAIKMRLFSLKKSSPPTLGENEDLGVISSEIDRLEKIVKQILEFARPGEPEVAVIETSQLIANVADLLAGSLRKRGVQLEAELPEKLSILADRQQIQQVLINLVLNGAESIEGAGVVTIRSCADTAILTEGTRPIVRIEVSDTGKGIAPQAEQRIFDPFFSTKEGGTGLGLSIAARIVERHGGFIQHTTRVGSGTTFTIVLPQHLA
jgi:signal transduction histidine kinase